MERRLYKAQVGYDIMVLAESVEHAAALARRFARDELENGDFEVSRPTEVTELRQVPPGWRDSLPWSDCDGFDVGVVEGYVSGAAG